MMGSTQKTVIVAGALAVAGACVLYLLQRRSSSSKKKADDTQSKTRRRKKSNTPTVTLTQSSEDGKQVSVLHNVASPESNPVLAKLDETSTSSSSKSKDNAQGAQETPIIKATTSECVANNNQGSCSKDSDKTRDSLVSDNGSNLVRKEEVEQVSSFDADAIESELTEQKVKVAYVQPLNQSNVSDNNKDVQPQANDNIIEEQIVVSQAALTSSSQAPLSQHSNKKDTDQSEAQNTSWGDEQSESIDRSEALTVQTESSAPAVRTRSQSGGNGNGGCHSSDSGVSVQSENEVSKF